MTFKKMIKLLLNPKLFYIKVNRWLGNKYNSLKVRFKIKFGSHHENITSNCDFDQSGHLITRPGNPHFFNKYNSDNFVNIDNDFKNILKHRFKIFSREHYLANHDNPKNFRSIAKLAVEIPSVVVKKYIPIDWHRDIRSGYRWCDSLLYLDVPLIPVFGADIKVPREMSRFQHIGEMIFADRQQAADEFCLQLLDWITANPLKRGVNWACTMDVAIRAVNWVWGIRFFENELAHYPKIGAIISQSLIEHGRHIYDNLEYYEECTGNHYLSNISGLIYISARFPDYKDSDEWLLFGIQELVSEMNRQVYDDGYSHEASTHYHRLVVEIFLSTSILVERIPNKRRKKLNTVTIQKSSQKWQLRRNFKKDVNLQLEGTILPSEFYETLRLMVECSAALTKPNGLVPQIGDNDSARLHKLLPSHGNSVFDHSHIMALGGELFNDDNLRLKGAQSKFEADLIVGDFANSGLNLSNKSPKKFLFDKAGIAVLSNNTAWLCITCGSNGQNQRGGHGHNDKNSFELNVAGYDYIVDGGCPFYTSNPQMRNAYRSSFAHSTLTVSGKEQDQWENGIGGLFILNQTCDPKLKMNRNGKVEGLHKGYGKKHVRTFSLYSNKLEIDDYCAAPDRKYLSFNFAPSVTVENILEDNRNITAVLRHKNGKKVFLLLKGAESPEVINGFYSEGFGLPVTNKMLKVNMPSYSAETVFSW